MKQLDTYSSVYLGCDPEFFFTKNGETIGAESVLPKDGLKNVRKDVYGDVRTTESVIIDGVQGELNPKPDICRQVLARSIIQCFILIQKQVDKDKSIKADFSQTKKLSKKEMDNLSEKAKKFGCEPSKNFHKKDSKITVNPQTYNYRSGGGHIHLGKTGNEKIDWALDNPRRLVPLLDILVGIPSVLLDRDSGNIERRKVYGRAGEYRTPKHGVEYRTLSNYWLKNYALMSFVMGMSRMAINVLAYSTPTHNFEKMFISKVNMDKVAEAINKNDFDKAYKIFKQIEPVLKKICPKHSYPLTKDNMTAFHHFVKKGTDYWFREDTFESWLKENAIAFGWERFLENIVKWDMHPIKK